MENFIASLLILFVVTLPVIWLLSISNYKGSTKFKLHFVIHLSVFIVYTITFKYNPYNLIISDPYGLRFIFGWLFILIPHVWVGYIISVRIKRKNAS